MLYLPDDVFVAVKSTCCEMWLLEIEVEGEA
jgi:hypothetical protein